jgi:hypothetical protein
MEILCPSAISSCADSFVFGIVGDENRVIYIKPVMRIEDARALLPAGLTQEEVFRAAAPCIKCGHWDGNECSLGNRVATLLEPDSQPLPDCAIRPHCRWHLQRGLAACRRCPQVITSNYDPGADMVQVA